MRQRPQKSRKSAGRQKSGATGRPRNGRGRLVVESLEARSLLTIYNPVGVTLAPSPVEGTAFAGAVVGTFASSDALGGLSATINWGPTATPTSSVGTINLIGSMFVPGVGTVPQYSVTGGTTYPEETGSSSQPITVTVSDAADSTNGIITSSTTVADAPMTTTGGIASASVTEGARVNYTGAIALMTFTDGNPNSTAAEFSASVSWGDGSPATLGTITKSGATYSVSGIHTYPQHTTGTPYTIQVRVTDLGGQTATHSTAITVTDAALSGPTAFPITAASGQRLSNVYLGTFLDGNPSATAADFTVSINWGDGVTNDPGTATLVGGSASNAKFAVGGSHTYGSAAGSPYAVTISVTDSGGATTTINSAVTVTQTPLAVSVPALNSVAGSPIPGQVIASFFDAGGGNPIGSYSATLAWGDGTGDTTAGGLTIAAVPGQPGFYNITAPAHTYAKPGLYPTTVTIDSAAQTSGSGNGSALVAPASLMANGAGPISNAVQGVPLAASTQVAGFSSADPAAAASDFSAVVDWGDGTPASPGTITQPGGVGTAFLVSGSHTYAQAAPAGYNVSARISDAYGMAAVATTQVTAVLPALTTIPGGPILGAVEGSPIAPTTSLASFSAGDPAALASDFSAVVDWGDGTPASLGTITQPGGVGTPFVVSGGHTYAHTAPMGYAVTVRVSNAFAASAAVTSVSSVADAPLSNGASLPIATTERVSTRSIPIATFVDGNPTATASDFSAVIDWGDGTGPDANAQVVLVGGNASGAIFAVYGSHTYVAAGSYSVVVSVSDAGGQGLTIVPASANAVVAQSSLSVAVLPQATQVGVAIPAGAVIGTFNDASGAKAAGLYSASITWGDGSTADTLVTITPLGGTAFSVSTSNGHTYAAAGSYALKLTVSDAAVSGIGGNLVVVNGAVTTPPALAPSAPIVAVEGTSFSGTVASFKDDAPGVTAAGITALINWGDGTPATPATIVQGAGSGNFFVQGSHTYARHGAYVVGVSLTDPSSNPYATSNTAIVGNAALASAAVAGVSGTEGIALANVVVGSFTDANPLAKAGGFVATIHWGDGGTSLGTITQPGGPGAAFVVQGSHTYGSGSFAIAVVVQDDGGQQLVLNNTATVADIPMTVAGLLNPADDHGASNSDGITNVNTPSFLGTSQPGSLVRLYVASPAGAFLAGQAMTGSDGHFTVQVNTPLADGSYTVGLVATDASGGSSAAVLLPQSLVIDTVGPRVVGLQLDRASGRIYVAMADDRSGLDRSTTVDGTNYQFGKYLAGRLNHRYPMIVTSLSASAVANPTAPQAVAITVQQGRAFPRGRYFLTISSSGGGGTLAGNGVCDVAGNALDGEFYGTYASGNHKPGGNFSVALDATRRQGFTAFALQDGYATPNKPTAASIAAAPAELVILQKPTLRAAAARLHAKATHLRTR